MRNRVIGMAAALLIVLTGTVYGDPAKVRRAERVQEQRVCRVPDSAFDWTVSGDGLHVAFGMERAPFGLERRSRQFVLVDGEAGPSFDLIGRGSLIFSPEGGRLAYVGGNADRLYVVVDGEAGRGYDGIAKRGVVFSSDGRRVAYLAKRWGKRLVVVRAFVKKTQKTPNREIDLAMKRMEGL